MAGDLYFDKVVLLLHGEGSDGSTTITDNAPVPKTPTLSGNVQIDTAQYKFGSASILFDGQDSPSSYLYYADSADWHFPGAYTIEFWIRPNSTKANLTWLFQQSAGTGDSCPVRIDYTSSGTINVLGSTNNSSWEFTTGLESSALSNGTWYHVALTDDGTTCRLFFGGTLAASRATWTKLDSSEVLRIGGGHGTADREFDGWIDDLRITKGVARYTANFTPPTARLPDGYQLAANDSTEAHQSPDVILKNIYCFPVSQANESPSVAITQVQALTVGSDSQANQSAGGNVGIVSSIGITIDTRTYGSSGIGIRINPLRSGSTSISITVGPYTGTSTIPIRINPRRSGTTTIPITIYGDLTAEAGAQSVTWRPKCVLGGTDISAKLVGTIEIESEEMAAPVASFSFLPAAGTVDPLAYVGDTVVLSWQRYVSGVLSGERVRFTGIVSDPVWDADNRLIGISATGDLQSIFDGMEKTAIAAMISNGTWSDTVFGPPEDVNGWDYAEALLSTCDDVVWQDASGAIRVSSTVAKGSADFAFEDSGRFEGSLRLDYASRMDFVTRAVLVFEHRFKRRRQRNFRFTWWPVELETPCHYFTGGYELPQRSMVESAANGGGLTVIGSILYRAVWPSDGYRCLLGDPVAGQANYGHIAWVNNPAVTDALCTGATWVAGKRWMQDVTETHTLTVNASESQATIGILPIEESYTVESEADDPTWETSLEYTGYTGTAVVMANGVDRRDDLDVESRTLLEAAEEVALAKARAEIRKSHRNTTVTFSTVYQPMLDLSHTVEVDCAALECQGKVRRIRDRWDIDTGDCQSEITVALHRRNGSGLTSDDTLAAPDKPADPDESTPATRFGLGFHLGGDANSPLFDDEWDGYISNYPDLGDKFYRMRTNPLVAARVYEESFTVIPPEIDEQYVDPADVTAAETFEVTIPEDNLVLTSY